MMMIKMIIVEAREKARITLERVASMVVILVLCHNSCKYDDNGNKGNCCSDKKDNGDMVNSGPSSN